MQVESRRAWILAHRFFRQFADELVIYEVLSHHLADKRPVSPEPPGRLVRNRGAHEPDGFDIPPLPPGLVVDCVQLVRARAQAGESLAGTHHSLSGASRLSLLHAHEETENRKQPATRERRAVLNGWVGGGVWRRGNLAALEGEHRRRRGTDAGRMHSKEKWARGGRNGTSGFQVFSILNSLRRLTERTYAPGTRYMLGSRAASAGRSHCTGSYCARLELMGLMGMSRRAEAREQHSTLRPTSVSTAPPSENQTEA